MKCTYHRTDERRWRCTDLCPSNTDEDCNIVKDKVFKGWAADNVKAGISNVYGKLSADTKKWGRFKIPCTITIKHADYEKLRRKGL